MKSIMARSFSNAKFLSALVTEEFSNAIFRRGYAATATASQVSVSSGGRGGAAAAMKKKMGAEESARSAQVSWIPDPKTGYYRPDNGGNEIDPAELRAVLLNHNKH